MSSSLVNKCWHLNDIIKKLIRLWSEHEPDPGCDYSVEAGVLTTPNTDDVRDSAWFVLSDAEVEDSVLYLCYTECDYSVQSGVLDTPNTDDVQDSAWFVSAGAEVEDSVLYLCPDNQD